MQKIYMVVAISLLIVCMTAMPAWAAIDPTQPYSYQRMYDDLQTLHRQYPELITLDTIGKSLDGRELMQVKLGKGSTLVHINAATHARERITTNIVLQNLQDYCQAYYNHGFIAGYDVYYLLDHVTIYYVPMVNPDGVDLTIAGPSAVVHQNLLSALLAIPTEKSGYPGWKANLAGVDLNRQYPKAWAQTRNNPGRAAANNFTGWNPISEPESQAMYQHAISKPFAIYASYHTQGQYLYWYNNQTGDLLAQSLAIKDKIRALTGFTPESLNPDWIATSGFSTWVEGELMKPAFTPEFCPMLGDYPYPESKFWEIYNPGQTLALLLAQEALALEPYYPVQLLRNNQYIQRFHRADEAVHFKNTYLSWADKVAIIYNGMIVYDNRNTSDKIQLSLDEKPVDLQGKTAYLNENADVMLPLRPLAIAAGIDLQWRGDIRELDLVRSDQTVKIEAGSYRVSVNGQERRLSYPAVMFGNSLYMKASDLAACFAWKSEWQADSKQFILDTGQVPAASALSTHKGSA